MNLSEQIYNLIWTFLAIGICIESVRLGLWEASNPGSGLIPFLSGLLIGLIGIVQFTLEWSKGFRKGIEKKFWASPVGMKRIIYIIGSLCVMASLMPILGFFPTTFLIMILLLRVIEPQKWIMVIGLSLASCFLVYLLFSCLLHISLPKGFLGI